MAIHIRQRYAHVITGHDAPQGGRNRLKELPKIQMRDNAVVHIEEQVQPIMLARELLLQGLGFLGMQGVVHGDRHVGRHQLREGDSRGL